MKILKKIPSLEIYTLYKIKQGFSNQVTFDDFRNQFNATTDKNIDYF